jgi:ribosomal protein S18 acetylase RimI-like enzyme
MIVAVDKTNLLQAAIIHSVSWKESHSSFCAPDFVEMHTPERQQGYIQSKIDCGSRFFMLIEDDEPIGIVSVKDDLIEDLYILPQKQRMGYGTKLLQFAMEQCTDNPTLWILENNSNAKRLYHKMGFQETGRINMITDELNEIELSYV